MNRRDHDRRLKEVGRRAWWEVAADWLARRRKFIELRTPARRLAGYQPDHGMGDSQPPQSGSGVPRFTMD